MGDAVSMVVLHGELNSFVGERARSLLGRTAAGVDNALNRVITVVLLLAALVAVVLLAIFPIPILDWLAGSLDAWSGYFRYWEESARYSSVGIRWGCK